jgi:hypothetical protein
MKDARANNAHKKLMKNSAKQLIFDSNLIEEGEESENAENNPEPEEHQEIPENSGTQTVTTTRQLSTNEFLQ